MTENELPPLPVDIPWKRLCVSRDMIVQEVCDDESSQPTTIAVSRSGIAHKRWQPSIAIFSYEPPAEEQIYDDWLVTYLKVSCTITGDNPGLEIQAEKSPYDFWYDPLTGDVQLKMVQDYLGCYGALLQVAVKPALATDDLDKYPFFADFQPKKRELYELVTQTGSTMSRSLESVQVRKGLTTASSTEVMDADTDIDWSTVMKVGGGAIGAYLGGPPGAAIGSGVGSVVGGWLGGGEDASKTINQTQQSNLRTTDNSLEKREEFSHTTQLTQMYHQLTSYHLGTNRAMFFVLPRPHIVQTEQTFVDGPRVLEGIQEFMLVMMRHRSSPDFCVEAYLETAHIHYDRPPATEELFERNFGLPTGIVPMPTWTDGDTFVPKKDWEFDIGNPKAPDGYKVEMAGPEEAKVNVDVKITEDNKAVVSIASEGNVAGYIGGTPLYSYASRHMWFKIRFYLRKSDVEIKDVPTTLYIKGHDLCCCQPVALFPTLSVSLIDEVPIKGPTGVWLADPGGMSISQANQITTDIGQHVIRSVNSPTRYQRGAVTVSEAQFFADSIARRINRPDHPDNQPLADIAGLQPDVRDKVLNVMPELRRADVLRMKLIETQDRFDLTVEETLHLRRAALRLEEPEPEPGERWDPPRIRLRRPVPNLVGLPFQEAWRMLVAAGLLPGDISYQDSEQPTHSVLTQYPDAGEQVRGDTRVDLVLATGLSVRIPDIIGKPLSEALCMLREAGLEAEPQLRFVQQEGHQKNTVVDVNPAPRTYVAPHTQLTLLVSR